MNDLTIWQQALQFLHTMFRDYGLAYIDVLELRESA